MHEFIQFWRSYAKNLHVCLIIITMMFQVYMGWRLLDSNSTKTRTEAFITQNQKDWRRCKLKHSQPIGTGRPTTFEFSDLGAGQLCYNIITNVAAVVYRLLDQWRLF